MNQELLLSVLIPSIQSRFAMAQALVNNLESQVGNEPVEILVLTDNKRMTVGEKRDKLNQLGRGRFLTQLDDDDLPSGDYISRLLTGIREFPDVDCQVFNQRASVNGREFTVRFGLEKENQQLDLSIEGVLPDLGRKPFPCCAWRRTLAQKYHYSFKQWGEDWDFIQQLLAEAKTQNRIDHVLHYYRYDDAVTEAK